MYTYTYTHKTRFKNFVFVHKKVQSRLERKGPEFFRRPYGDKAFFLRGEQHRTRARAHTHTKQNFLGETEGFYRGFIRYEGLVCGNFLTRVGLCDSWKKITPIPCQNPEETTEKPLGNRHEMSPPLSFLSENSGKTGKTQESKKAQFPQLNQLAYRTWARREVPKSPKTGKTRRALM